jgi:hypothetical protein
MNTAREMHHSFIVILATGTKPASVLAPEANNLVVFSRSQQIRRGRIECDCGCNVPWEDWASQVANEASFTTVLHRQSPILHHINHTRLNKREPSPTAPEGSL